MIVLKYRYVDLVRPRSAPNHVEMIRQAHGYPVAVAMEGYNGHARPLDALILAQGYHLFNINNLKLARFKEIFPAAAKTDEIDARKALELFQLRDIIPTAKGVLQEVGICPEENAILKRLTRRRRRLVNERVRLLNSLQDDLHAVCPGLLEITNDAGNLWFLNFLTSTDNLPKLARLRRSSLLKIQGVGIKYAGLIQGWQKRAQFSPEVKWTGEMILEDATRILELHAKIKALEAKMETVAKRSQIATLFWFSVNWRIPPFELDCANGGIHHAKKAEKLHGSGEGFHSQALPG